MTKRETIHSLITDGKTTREIAEVMGYTTASVRYHRESRRKENQKRYTAEHRRRVKRKAVDYSGGRCVRCGYGECNSALVFHHPDPDGKELGIAQGNTRSWRRIKDEVDKTIMVCRNCHSEAHSEMWQVSDEMMVKQDVIRRAYADKPLKAYADKLERWQSG